MDASLQAKGALCSGIARKRKPRPLTELNLSEQLNFDVNRHVRGGVQEYSLVQQHLATWRGDDEIFWHCSHLHALAEGVIQEYLFCYDRNYHVHKMFT